MSDLDEYEQLGEQIAEVALGLGANPDILGDLWDAPRAAEYASNVVAMIHAHGIEFRYDFDAPAGSEAVKIIDATRDAALAEAAAHKAEADRLRRALEDIARRSPPSFARSVAMVALDAFEAATPTAKEA